MTTSQQSAAGHQPMRGKTVLITGATNGIGKAAAQALIHQGASVWLVGRSPEKTAATQRELGAAGHFLADLSLRGEADRMAREFGERRWASWTCCSTTPEASTSPRQETREGIELTWALNHLAYFIVTRELLPLLREARRAGGQRVERCARQRQNPLARPRVQNRLQRLGGLQPEQAGQYLVYPRVGLPRARARRQRQRPASGPGGLGLRAQQQPDGQAPGPHCCRCAKTDEQGAKTSIYLASSPEVEAHQSGLYFSDERVTPPAAQALDDAAGKAAVGPFGELPLSWEPVYPLPFQQVHPVSSASRQPGERVSKPPASSLDSCEDPKSGAGKSSFASLPRRTTLPADYELSITTVKLLTALPLAARQPAAQPRSARPASRRQC